MESPVGFGLSGIFYVLFPALAAGYICSMGKNTESIGWRENLSYFQSRLKKDKNRNSWGAKGNRLTGGRYPLDVIIEGDTGLTQQHQRQQDKEAVAAFNAKVQAWGSRVDAALRSSIEDLIDKDVKLSGSLKQNYRHYGKPVTDGEEVTSIGFSFKPEGIYVHLGVGRGYNMQGGTRVLTKKSDDKWNREPKPWFNPVIEQHIPELIEIVKEYCGTLLVNTTRIFINT